MAAPILSIVNAVAETNFLDLTALTSEGGAWNQKQGSTGSDWIFPNNYGQNSLTSTGENYRRKLNGDDQIQFRRFVQSEDPSENIWMQPVTMPNGQHVQYDNADTYDAFGSNVFSNMFRLVMLAVQNPCGLRFTMPADQKLRKFRWFGYVDGFGPATFVAKATLSDGSLPPVTQVLNRGGVFSDFSVSFRAIQPDTVLTVEVANTVGSGSGTEDYTFIALRAALLEKAVPAPKPKGFKNNFLYVGSYGGPNA